MICSATETHAQFMEESAVAGKHIFCEKPIDRNVARIDEALAAVHTAGVKLQIGFQRRFDPSLRRVHDIVAGGKIGVPQVVRIFSREPEPPPLSYVAISGGLFFDSTIHDFDLARFLIQDEIDEIFAVGRVVTDARIADFGDIDSALVLLRYRSGALGVIDNSRQSGFQGYDQRVEVSGSQGWVRSENDKVDTTQLTTVTGEQRALPPFSFVERYREAYIIEMQEFVKAMLEDKTPAVTGWDGRMPVLMGYAAKKSYEENRPVELSEIDTELNDKLQ